MSDATNRAIVETWADATVNHDCDTVRRSSHPDYLMDWPQTGERIRGVEASIALDVGYPGGAPDAKQIRLSGTDDRWVLDAFQRPIASPVPVRSGSPRLASDTPPARSGRWSPSWSSWTVVSAT
jgi:hypothetical protein